MAMQSLYKNQQLQQSFYNRTNPKVMKNRQMQLMHIKRGGLAPD